MIEHFQLPACGCTWENGSWDLCLFHRHKEGSVSDYDGPIPLSGLDEEPEPVPESNVLDEFPIVGPMFAFKEIQSIFDAASGRADPYEASTRQARAEREAPKANHCPTCTCKKEK